MHDLYPQKRPPTLLAITWGFVIATFLPPAVFCWFVVAHAPDGHSGEIWQMVIPIALAAGVGIVLGCCVSNDLPVGCAILLSPLVPMAFWFVLAVGMGLWRQEFPFSRILAFACMPLPAILLLSTPTAGVFVLTRWMMKGRV
jgi:hypothetical protein